MAYEYHMVYLPHIQPSSFLLFVHDKEGRTKLRDYSSGYVQVKGQPGIRAVFDRTSESTTRFRQDVHTVSDYQHWSLVTQRLNKRLPSEPSIASPIAASPMSRIPPQGAAGRLRAGSSETRQPSPATGLRE